MKTFLLKNGIWILLLICILSRLPQFFNPYLLLDGDECIVGLMAKHLLEGKELPLYFYGQSYGFSFIELLFIAVFYFLFGISAMSVKLAMLCLWTIGVLFFYKALRQINAPDSFTPLLISLVLALLPAWAIWSMMARGGYLTAFTLSNICLFMLFRQSKQNAFFSFLIPGFLCVLIYESHALWLPGIIPVIVYVLWKQKKIKPVLFAGSGFLIATVLFYFSRIRLSTFWPRPVTYLRSDVADVFREMPEQIFYNMTGSYAYKQIINMGVPTNVLALLFTLCIFSGLLLVLYFFLRKRGPSIMYVFSVSILLTLLSLFLIPDYAPRYLLPLSAYALFMFSLLVNKIRSVWLYSVSFIPFITLGAWSLFNFKDFRSEGHTEKSLTGLSEWLVSRKIQHVFCKGALLQWQISFYSKEKVIARYIANTDRYPEYISRVNTAFMKGKPTALVDFYYFAPMEQTEHKILVVDNYVVDPDPSPETLAENGFDPGAK